jgi:hypothetical protein
MGRRRRGATQCSICLHEKRASIELALVLRVPTRVLAKRFDVSRDALYRHGRRHLSPQQRAALLAAQKPTAVDLEKLQASESEGLLAQLVAQRARLQTYAEQALELGDPKAAVSVERGITANLELVAKLLGQLVQHHEVRSTSILVSPDYIALRHAIVKALQPFPDAARAVGAALHALESRAAAEITEAAKQPLMIEAKAEAVSS